MIPAALVRIVAVTCGILLAPLDADGQRAKRPWLEVVRGGWE
jgi:hypothetical protein